MPADTDEIARVIDIGCGTGLTGMYLSHLRSTLEIDGLDISPEMLAEASHKKRTNNSAVYTNLNECDLTQSVVNKFEPYDALICSGTCSLKTSEIAFGYRYCLASTKDDSYVAAHFAYRRRLSSGVFTEYASSKPRALSSDIAESLWKLSRDY